MCLGLMAIKFNIIYFANVKLIVVFNLKTEFFVRCIQEMTQKLYPFLSLSYTLMAEACLSILIVSFQY